MLNRKWARFGKNRDRGTLIVISGPSGVGKSSICGRILKRDRRTRYSVSATTRAPRPGEKNRRHYIFLKPREFRRWIRQGKFIEHARVHENLYGTPRRYLETQLKKGYDVILDIDVQGGRNLMREFPDEVFIFVAAPSMDELSRRLRMRGADSSTIIKKRLVVARKEMKQAKHYNYLVGNQDLARTVDMVRTIIKVERYKRRLVWR